MLRIGPPTDLEIGPPFVIRRLVEPSRCLAMTPAPRNPSHGNPPRQRGCAWPRERQPLSEPFTAPRFERPFTAVFRRRRSSARRLRRVRQLRAYPTTSSPRPLALIGAGGEGPRIGYSPRPSPESLVSPPPLHPNRLPSCFPPPRLRPSACPYLFPYLRVLCAFAVTPVFSRRLRGESSSFVPLRLPPLSFAVKPMHRIPPCHHALPRPSKAARHSAPPLSCPPRLPQERWIPWKNDPRLTKNFTGLGNFRQKPRPHQ